MKPSENTLGIGKNKSLLDKSTSLSFLNRADNLIAETSLKGIFIEYLAVCVLDFP